MSRSHQQKKEVFEPPVSQTTDGRQVQVTIGLPGIAEEQIRIDLEKTVLSVSVLDDGVIRKKTIRIPPGARISRKKFFDGELEIVLEKPGS